MQRVLAVWCPDLLEEQEDGRRGRAFARVTEAVGTFSPAVEVVRSGVCVVGTRGPSRYFGGDDSFARLLRGAVEAVDGVTAGVGVTVGVGVADGLFAAVLAARCPGTDPVVVAPARTREFLAPWPVTTLERPELADLLDRLGVRTLGRFAALPGRHVLARFGVDGAACHRVALGIEGELPGLRLSPRRSGPAKNGARRGGAVGGGAGGPSTREPEFWGGEAGAAARAGRALTRIQHLLGPEAVVTGRLQGGRGPAERVRVVPWSNGPGGGSEQIGTERHRRVPPEPPWPGQVPPPAPVIVLSRPVPVELVDTDGRLVGVSGGGMVTSTPTRLSVDGGPWATVAGWAGPWPSDERWWSAPRRQARMQVVTGAGTAHLLTRERGSWWLEGTYD